MSQIEVKIVKLEPMRVASALGFGKEPESIAWIKILAYATARGLNPDDPEHRFFGFNNPDPSLGSDNYGYEQWMTIGPDISGNEEIAIKEIPEGLYAVTRFKGLENIGKTWQALVHWFEDSKYKRPSNWAQCLEEFILSPIGPIPPEEMVFDLYLPISE